MSEPAAAQSHCDHHYETRLLGGHPITVRACTLCRTPDWNDLAEQANALYQWGREEALAGKPPRDHLSAYDMPREQPDAGPTVRECAEADRNWDVQKAGE
jgi:hypothetical protein